MYRGGIVKRRIVQIITTLISNSHLTGFWQGTIYRGKMKYLCVPGLNCYSCPGAIGSCPLGALQAVLGSARYLMSFYVVGLLTFFGTLLGRFICGWLCPFGFLQELIYKIKTKKMILPPKIDRPLRYLKYLILLLFVILLPLTLTNQFGNAAPYFCQWICPAGTLEGGIPLLISNEGLRRMVGFLFGWKMLLLLLTLGSALLIHRFFCKYLCPLGAFYALFNKISFFAHLNIDQEKCTGCNTCSNACPMQVPVWENPNHQECIRCGACIKKCPHEALNFTWWATDAPVEKQSKLPDNKKETATTI
jgi:ferredoxin-type protein NapH